jgi:serine phosphatase RsbU (regulator of sigma subunit)
MEASSLATETTLLHKILGEEQLSTRVGPRRSGWTSPVTALIRAGRELSVPRPLGELFEIILDLATEAVGADRGVLMTIEDGRLVVKAKRGNEFQLSQNVQARVLEERVSLIVRDTRVEGEWQARQSIISQGIRSLMAAPLQTDERVIGLLYLDSPGWARQFTSQDLELLTVMANIAAMRIERERLAEVERANQWMESELRQAAEIQQQCLPATPPRVPGLDLAGYTLPCRTVGGDYFDYFPLPDGRLCVVVADVSGKGMPASLLMMNLQARAQILAQEQLDPAVMMERLNRSLIGICPSNRFVTAFLCVVDPRSGYTSYCNGGHERALLIRADGRVEELGVGGPVVGLLTGIGYELGECMLQPGDSLVLFSDGATEARNPRGEEFGSQRIAAACTEAAGVDAQTQLGHVNAAILRWLAGQPAHDDLTVVTVVKKAGGE